MAQIGDEILRKEVVEATVKGFAERAYKFKQAVSIVSTSAWMNTFYRETSTPLAGGTEAAIEGIPRGAAFPVATVTWTQIPTWIKKHGLQDTIHWEDIISDNIDVQSRVMFRIGEGVAKSVDDEIYDVISEGASMGVYGPGADPANINHVAIASLKHWSGASAAIIDNLLYAAQLIATYNYSTSDLLCFVSPRDFRSIGRWVTDKGAQFVPLADETARNGRLGRLAGVTLVESNSVPASCALVVVPRICATWKELVPFQTTTIIDPYKSVMIRAVEEGAVELTDPHAISLITNTQGPGIE